MTFAILATSVILIALAWKFLPVGRLHGRQVRLGELARSSTRFQLAHQKAENALERVNMLPPDRRFSTLAALEHKYGEMFLVGDNIRRAILATGLDEAAVHLKRILQTPHGGGTVMSGIRDALGGEMKQQYRMRAFQFLVDALDHRESFGVAWENVPSLLLELDEDWAVRVLKSGEYLDPHQPGFKGVLSALVHAGASIDRPMIDEWLAGFEGRNLGWAEGQIYIEVLKALHEHDAEKCESLLEKAVHDRAEFAVDAAETLLQARDLPHPVFYLDDLEHKVGLAGLSSDEKIVWLVSRYVYWMGMGDLHGVPEDEDSALMSMIPEALNRVGAPKHAGRFSAFVAICKLQPERGESWTEEVERLMTEHNDLEPNPNLLALEFELQHRNTIRKSSEIRVLLGYV
jgi:hypothetical protein